MKCARCGSTQIRASQQKQLGNAVVRLLGRAAFRCRECKLRFFAAADQGAAPTGTIRKERSAQSRLKHWYSKGGRRKVIEAAVFGAVLLVFLVFMRYILAEPGGGSASFSGTPAAATSL